MNNYLFWFIVILLLASLFQVGVVALPVGIIALFSWFLLKGTKHLIILTLLYTLFLASMTNIPGFAILLSTILSFVILIAGRWYLPQKYGVTVILILSGVFIWEGTLFILLRLGV